MERKTERGAAAVEFAILMLPLMTIILLIIDFSLALYDKAVITNATQEAARAGIVARSPNRLTEAEIKNVAQQIYGALLIGPNSGGTSSPTVTVTPSNPIDRANFQDKLTVSITYNYRGFILGAMASLLSTGEAFKIHSTTSMLNE